MRRNGFLCLLLLAAFAYAAGHELDSLTRQAEDEVSKENEEESKQAKQINDSKPNTDDAFRWVQKFLVSFPKSCATSKPGKVLEKISRSYLKRHSNLRPNEAFALLGNFRPLKEFGKLAGTDETDSQDTANYDVATCPYQPINCTGQARAHYRTIDGSCNNLRRPMYGKAFTPFARFLRPEYADGISAPRKAADGSDLPSPRLVSSKFTVEIKEKEASLSTYMLMTWGQFVDHDIDLTAISKMQLNDQTVDIKCGDSGCDGSVEGCFPIPVPDDDPVFKGKNCLTFVRSQGVPNKRCSLGPRRQLNQITSFIDGSNVYGSTKAASDFIRDTDKSRGRMKTSVHPFNPKMKHLLPQAENAQCKGTTDKIKCFKAGDVRANEAPHLTTSHTIMVREHNRVEEKLHKLNPHWSGETLFQETRKIISAVLQRVTYKEYLPAIYSKKEMEEHGLTLQETGFFKGYDDKVNPSASNVFATAAYRYGHSMIPGAVERPKADFKPNKKAEMKLSETLFRPAALYDLENGGLDGFVRGLAAQKCTVNDRFFSDQVANHLFAENAPNGPGTDLISLNIQRGRDHGLPGYNAWREYCDLTPIKSFNALDKILRRKDAKILKKLYKTVDDIDIFPAGLAEKPVSKQSILGETFSCILGRQFRKLRVGDRFWHERPGQTGFTSEQLQEIRKMTLAKLFCTNSDNVPKIQPQLMYVSKKKGNKLVECDSLPDIDFTKWQQVTTAGDDADE